MYQRQQRRAAILFAAADLMLVAVAFAAAFLTRSALPMRALALDWPTWLLVLLASMAAALAAGRWTGTYERLGSGGATTALGSTAKQGLVAALPLLAFLYLLNLEVPVSRLFMALFLGYLACLQVAQRALAAKYRGTLHRAFGSSAAVVVAGDSERALRIAAEIDASASQGLRLHAVIDCSDGPGALRDADGTWRILPPEALARMLTEEAIDELLFAVSGDRLPGLEGMFVLCDEHGVTTRVVADFFPHAHSQLHFDRFGEHPVLTFSTAPADEAQLLLKRCCDALVSGAALAALCVPMAAVGLLVRATSAGPAIFRQQRCGLNGRLFTCYKFRSMVADAERRKAALDHLNEKDGPAFKMRDDPRLTPVGRFLRRYSIDEWPQFWNVLRGEMSLVGPRPAVPAEVSQYQTWQRRRLRMRPGLTCLWAVRGRDRLDFESWMQLDLEYIDNWSLWLDAKIVALTVPLVLLGRGAN